MAARITAGPADEATQALTFQASSDNPGLFAVQPTVFGDGTLTYTPAPNAYGSAAVTVVLHDNGGTANGGVDTSAPQTFTLTIAPVNDAPAFELTQAVEVSLDTAALAGMSGQLAVDLIDGDGVADNSVISRWNSLPLSRLSADYFFPARGTPAPV